VAVLTADWIQRSGPFLVAMIAVSLVIPAIYSLVYFREKAGLARPRRMRSAKGSAMGLTCFPGLLAVRVFVVHA
jgi:hypothetical protein